METQHTADFTREAWIDPVTDEKNNVSRYTENTQTHTGTCTFTQLLPFENLITLTLTHKAVQIQGFTCDIHST